MSKTIKTEGGQGGKRGHSNMVHWEYTEDIKREMRGARRRQGKREIREQLDDFVPGSLTRKTEGFGPSIGGAEPPPATGHKH
jgi:hypothetical protein